MGKAIKLATFIKKVPECVYTYIRLYTVMIEFNIYINLQLDIFLDSKIHATVYLYSIV